MVLLAGFYVLVSASVSDSSRRIPPEPCVASMYLAHHGWLVRMLQRKLGDHAHAADLAQDTFERVLRAPSLPVEAEARPWLTTIASRLAANHWRRRELEQAYLDALAARPELTTPSPETRLALMQTLEQIARLINNMPPRTRDVFLLSQLEGMAYAQIATHLGLSVSGVQKIMIRAFQQCYDVVYG